MKIPQAHYLCESCAINRFAIEAIFKAKELRKIGKQWICKDCYYDSLSERGLHAFKNDPSFSTFKKLSELIKEKRNIDANRS